MSNAFSKIDPNPCFKNKIRLAALSLDQPSQKAITFPNDGLMYSTVLQIGLCINPTAVNPRHFHWTAHVP